MTEALVALAILGAALALIYQAMGAGWGAVRRTSLEAQAVTTAMARLESVGREVPLREGTTEGRDDPFAWRLDVTRHELPGLGPAKPRVPAWWVKVEVTWQGSAGAGDRRVTFTTVRSTSTNR